MTPTRFTLPALVASLTTSVLAHDGPRIWVAQRDSTLLTQGSDNDFDPTSYYDEQVFSGQLSPYFGTYTTLFPGFEAPRDGSGLLNDGDAFAFRIAGPLLTLDASGNRLVPTSTRFASSTSAPQLAITYPDIPDQAYVRFTAAGIVEGFQFTTAIHEHAHLAFTLLGDGVSASAPSPDGMYVLPLLLTSPQYARSDWFFLALSKNATSIEQDAAIAFSRSMASARSGDTNFDGAVNFDDLLTLAQNYGTGAHAWWARGDFNFDGAVDFDDLLALAQNYGSTASFAADWAAAQALTPEPASLLIVAPLVCMARRRRV